MEAAISDQVGVTSFAIAARGRAASHLSELRGSHVEVRAARRGEKRRLQELATQNAELALKLARYAYVLETGSIALKGPAHELHDNAHVRRAYLGG